MTPVEWTIQVLAKVKSETVADKNGRPRYASFGRPTAGSHSALRISKAIEA